MSKLVWKPGTMLYPVPVVMVTAQHGGKANIITISWVGTVCTNPPMVSISVRPERYSYDLIKNSGEFVINVPGRNLAFAADFCGVRSGRDVDKFAFLRLTSEPGTQVQAPVIREAPLALECKVTQVAELGSHHMFIAEVVAVHVEEDLIDDKGTLHLADAGLIAYNHGRYCLTTEVLGTFGFSVERKRQAEYLAGLAGEKPDAESLPVDGPNREERRKTSGKNAFAEEGPEAEGDRNDGGRATFGSHRDRAQDSDTYFGARGRNAQGNKSFGGRGGKRRSDDFSGGNDKSAQGGKSFNGRGGKRKNDDFFGGKGQSAQGNKSFSSRGGKRENDDFFGGKGQSAQGNKSFSGRGGKQKSEGFSGGEGKSAQGNTSFGSRGGKQGREPFLSGKDRNQGSTPSFGGRKGTHHGNDADKRSGGKGGKSIGSRGKGAGATFSGKSGGGSKSRNKK